MTKTAKKTAAKTAAKKTATTKKTAPTAATLEATALQLRKDGLSFRAMEEKMFGAAGSGTKAFNLFNRAKKTAKKTAPTANGKRIINRGAAVKNVQTKAAPNGAQVIA